MDSSSLCGLNTGIPLGLQAHETNAPIAPHGDIAITTLGEEFLLEDITLVNMLQKISVPASRRASRRNDRN